MAQENATEFYDKQTAGDERQLGLCSTCNYMDTCVCKKTWMGPVMFCEEFDDCIPPEKMKQKQVKNSIRDTLAETTNNSPVIRGLCVNCEHLDICTLPKAEGGIWYCEEYE